jgi:ATP-dependent DNA helicase RecG
MLTAVEAGFQAALMAPTELLARQHHQTLAGPFAAVGARLGLLTGREKGAPRRTALADLAAGKTDVLIGTHALFQHDVAFRDLGLAVIDEQHRFGVHQRLALQAKSDAGAVDLLVLTATPIPRTLLLTHYGNMEVTRLAERPPGRGRVTTRVLADDRTGEVLERLVGAVGSGARAFWICPQIDEAGEDRTATAVQRYEELRGLIGDKVALAHGRMAGEERDLAMDAFRAGRAQVLVATTVVEVGVDVPEATIMVVESADRFGLAQLHQLRGRIGRGGRDGACLLVYRKPLGDIAAARLKILRQTEDGFAIAEEDLRLRGGGEILGTRQSGAPELRLADPIAHADLIEPAREQAERELAGASHLSGPRAEALRHLLYLFERDEAIRLTGAG